MDKSTTTARIRLFLESLHESILLQNCELIWFSIDLIIVCSALGLRRRHEVGDFCAAIHDLLSKIVEEKAGISIIVPAFTFTFGQKKEFDVLEDIPEVSAFAKYLFRNSVRRTSHPLYSFFVFGDSKCINYLEMIDSVGEKSPFCHINNMDSRVITVGHHMASALSSIHQIEYELGVEYREIIFLEGTVVDINKGKIQIKSRFFARKEEKCSFSSVTKRAVRMLYEEGFLNHYCIGSDDPIVIYTLDLKRAMHFIRESHGVQCPMVSAVPPKDSSPVCETFVNSDSIEFYKRDALELLHLGK